MDLVVVTPRGREESIRVYVVKNILSGLASLG
jgi:hypothetical protein